MKSDGTKIKALRESRGLTQDVLADAARCDRRTIQRAEQGKPLQLENLAGIASALQVSVSDLSIDPSSEPDTHDTTEDRNAVVLRKISSGKVLLDALATSFSGNVDCDIEPTPATVDPVVSLIAEIERLMPEPWNEEKFLGTPMPLSERLKRAVEITAQIQSLEQSGIGIFVGTYTASAQVPRYSSDEGTLYIRLQQPYEPVSVFKVRFASAAIDKIVTLVDDVWEPPAPAVDDDDIPF
jgi:transcriptional regulator with XRE-family HTH domain